MAMTWAVLDNELTMKRLAGAATSVDTGGLAEEAEVSGAGEEGLETGFFGGAFGGGLGGALGGGFGMALGGALGGAVGLLLAGGLGGGFGLPRSSTQPEGLAFLAADSPIGFAETESERDLVSKLGSLRT